MNGNGDDRYAALEGRIAELELAMRILTRRWEETLTPRLLALERDVDQLAGEIARRPKQ